MSASVPASSARAGQWRGRTAKAPAVTRRRWVAAQARANGTVRRARSGEVQQVAALFVAEFFFNGRSNEYDAAEVRALVNAQAQDMRKRYFGSRFDAALFVVEDEDGDVVACGGVSETPRDAKGVFAFALDAGVPAEGGSTAPVIANVAVSSSARRRGFGKQVMATLEGQCREWGAPESWLLVELRNGKAQALYRRLGYVSTKLVRADAFELNALGQVVGGSPRTLYMRKVLGPLGLLLNRDPFTPASLALGLLVLAGSYAEHAGLVPAGGRDQLARALALWPV